MNDLSNFWEEQEKKSQGADKTSAETTSDVEKQKRRTLSGADVTRGTSESLGVEKGPDHVDAKVRTSPSKSPVVEKTRRQLPAGPKRVLLATAILLTFGILIGTNLPHRDSGEKLLLDIKEDIGEEAKLAGTTLDKPELTTDNEATNAAVLGTAETSEGKIKVLSANLVGIWQKTKTGDQKPSFKDKKSSALKEPAEATESADKSDALNDMESVALNAETGDEEATSAAFPAEEKAQPRSSLEDSKGSTFKSGSALKLAGVRILGEIKNVGESTVYAANVFVRFYGKTSGVSRSGSPDVENSLLAIKVASWNQGYKFLPLAPGEIGVYDAVVLNPPEFETVTIEMKVDPTVKKSSFVTETLKVKSKALEPTTLQQGGQQINYFTFNGTLVNTGKVEIVNPAIYVWLKSREGKVIGLAAKTLTSDLLLPNQELSVSLFVIPTTTDEMFSYEVQTFGEKL